MSYIEVEDGVRLRLCDRGTGKPPIVLIHGWKGSHRLWDAVIARLQDTHRVVAFDLRGMGESDKPRARYDFDELSGDLGLVLRTLDLDEVVLVGWSMGTTVALRYLEQDGARARGLVIVNGPLRLTQTPDFRHTMTEAELEAHLTRLRDTWPWGERAFQAQTLLEPDSALVEWLYDIALQTPLDVALRVVREQAKLDMREALANLRIPVLAIYSEHDPYYPTSLADDIATRAADGRRSIFERSAHCIPLEEPDRLCDELIEFAGRIGR